MEFPSINSPTPKRPAKAPQNDDEPKPPGRRFFPAAVVTFMSGGQVIALGNTDPKNQGDDVKVAFTINHRSSDKPYLGFRVELGRKPAFHLTERHPE